MLGGRLGIATMLTAALILVSVPSALLVGCESSRLVDQNDGQIAAVVESIQANFAEEGWTYAGCELLETDEENDTATVSITYDVEGDAEEILRENVSEKPDDPAVYGLADGIRVKAIVELSAYDKDNDALGASLVSTQWFVGDTEAGAWIQEQNEN